MRGAVDDIKQEIMKETDEPISEIRDEIEKAKKEIENPDKPTQE